MLWDRVIIISPPKMRRSARNLAAGLKKASGLPAFLVKPTSKTYQPRWKDFIIYWGYSKNVDFCGVSSLNYPASIAAAVNKLETFNQLTDNEVSTVPYTTDKQLAQSWLDNNKTVVGRTKLNSFGGDGIVLMKPGDKLVDCPLYTQYIKKKYEYRVHVLQPNVIDTTIKRKKKGANIDTKIRNHGNGWVYCREDIEPDQRRNNLALAAIQALGLEHGAVDMIYNEKKDAYYVLEINTAPGLVGTTLNQYVQAIAKEIKRHEN